MPTARPRWPTADTYVYDVLLHLILPVRALPDDMLVVRPGHPERPIVVSRSIGGCMRPVRIGPPDYSALLKLEQAGAIRCAHPRYARVPLAQHPLVASRKRRKAPAEAPPAPAAPPA